MKTTIHPQYVESKIVCSCGNAFTSRSTKGEIHVEVCFKCHPFYTGEHRFIDTKGRVESFQKKQQAAKELKATYSSKKKKERKEENEPKSLRELLSEV